MALDPMKRSLGKVVTCSLLLLLRLQTVAGMSGWGGCLDGRDVFVSIRENSPTGEVVADLMTETTLEGVRWSLDGQDAGWLFLDEGNIRLNLSDDRVLDREVRGPFLIAELNCYEGNFVQAVYRVMVEILNENDNFPEFAEDTVHSLDLSEVTPVNTVAFAVRARDGDNDTMIYSIDETSPDADYFRIDLPNSGEVILAKPLDYETKTVLTVTIHASEMSTAEHFNTSTNVTITVLDADDQYPQFLPCMLLFQDETSRVCTSPVYTVNVTEGEEDIMLDFSPGPIHAVDGDKTFNSQVSYAILSGDDDGRFLMDRETGEMKMVHGVGNRLQTPELHLKVMAYQENDPRKYSVATVEVRVLAVNRFHPVFEMAKYQGFVSVEEASASLVNTYGNKALMLHVQDRDFDNGFNPKIHFSLSPTSNYTDIFQITQEGLLITKTSKLKPKQRHNLEVMAVDQESGDATFTTVVVDVLSKGQAVPYSALGDEQHLTSCTLGKAFFLSMAIMTALGCVTSLAKWLKRKHKGRRGPLERGCVAQGKHPNVSLRWFQLLSHRNAMPHMDEVPYSNEDYGTYNPSFTYTETPGTYPLQDIPLSLGPPGRTDPTNAGVVDTETVRSPDADKNEVLAPTKSPSSSLTAEAAIVDESNAHSENSGSPAEVDSTEAQPDTSTSPTISDKCDTPASTTAEDPPEPVASPSSQSSVPCSHARIASAEIDKPLCKSRAKTPPDSPRSHLSPLPRELSTPPLTPDHAPLKATLVHIDTSPFDTPLTTPKWTEASDTVGATVGATELSTSLDDLEQSEQPGGAEAEDAQSPSQDRRPSTNSGNTQAGDADDDGFLGDEDADKNSEGENDLDPEDEELLRVLARCNPIFFTFSK